MNEQSLFTPEEFKKLKPVKGGKRQKREEKLQLQVCNYLKNRYPDLIWFCDLASGLFLPPWIAAMNKKMRSSRALPDLFIVKSFWIEAHKVGEVMKLKENGMRSHGLFIELKKEGIRKKDGTIPPAWRKEKIGKVIVKYDHHAEQAEILRRLEDLNYKAVFACGYTEAIKIIDEYLSNT